MIDAPNTSFDDDCDSDHKELQEEDNEPTTDDNPRHTNEHYPKAGTIILYSSQNPPRLHQADNPLHPFDTVSEYKLAYFFHRVKVPKGMITEFFKNSLAPTDIVGYKSGETIRNTGDSMGDTPPWRRSEVDFPYLQGVEFYIQNTLEYVKYLLSQPAYADKMSCAPTRLRDSLGKRIYSEINTGDWWWETQVCILLL